MGEYIIYQASSEDLQNFENTELFGKVTRMLRKKAKMTFWWLNIGVNSIRTGSLCSRSLC